MIGEYIPHPLDKPQKRCLFFPQPKGGAPNFERRMEMTVFAVSHQLWEKTDYGMGMVLLSFSSDSGRRRRPRRRRRLRFMSWSADGETPPSPPAAVTVSCHGQPTARRRRHHLPPRMTFDRWRGRRRHYSLSSQRLTSTRHHVSCLLSHAQGLSSQRLTSKGLTSQSQQGVTSPVSRRRSVVSASFVTCH